MKTSWTTDQATLKRCATIGTQATTPRSARYGRLNAVQHRLGKNRKAIASSAFEKDAEYCFLSSTFIARGFDFQRCNMGSCKHFYWVWKNPFEHWNEIRGEIMPCEIGKHEYELGDKMTHDMKIKLFIFCKKCGDAKKIELPYER
jgi:hypothetical protein